MTDKITNDDVDVSECNYICKFTNICRNENIGRVVRPQCKNIKNCYFKQLKRKEQEAEYWRQELDKTHLLMLEKQDAYIAEFNKSYKYEQALDEIEKLTTIGEAHGLTDTQYVENFRLHQERILDVINKAKEEK